MRSKLSRYPVLLALLVIGAVGAGQCTWIDFATFDDYTVVSFPVPDEPHDLEFQLRAAFLTAKPGTVFELPPDTIRCAAPSCSSPPT